MALININADFSRVAAALERIADKLDFLYPPEKDGPVVQAGLEALTTTEDKHNVWQQYFGDLDNRDEVQRHYDYSPRQNYFDK